MNNIKFIARNFAMLQIDNSESNLEVESGAKNVVDGLYNMFGNYVAIVLEKDEILKSRGNLLSEKKVNLIFLCCIYL